eukprot:gene11008-12829_t
MKQLESSMSRYKETRTPTRDAEEQEWRSALAYAKTMGEYQDGRLVNLQLLQRFGANAWTLYLQELDTLHKTLNQMLKNTLAQIEQININRKLEQEGVQSKIDANQRKWYELVHKNQAIEEACHKLEQEIEKLQLGSGNGNKVDIK